MHVTLAALHCTIQNPLATFMYVCAERISNILLRRSSNTARHEMQGRRHTCEQTWHCFDQKNQLLKVHNQIKRNYSYKMTPGRRHLPALHRILLFEFPNGALSSTVLLVCSSSSLITALLFLFVATYIFMLDTQKRLWLWRLWWQRRDALRLAFTQLGHRVVLQPQGERWEREWEGQEWRRASEINHVEPSANAQPSYTGASRSGETNVQCPLKANNSVQWKMF